MLYNEIEIKKEVIGMAIYKVEEVARQKDLLDYVVNYKGKMMSFEEYLTKKEQEAVWDFYLAKK